MKNLILIIVLVSFVGCSTVKTMYQKGKTKSYEDRDKQEQQADEEHYWEHRRQYETFKRERYGK